jgi:hypothetical protein
LDQQASEREEGKSEMNVTPFKKKLTRMVLSDRRPYFGRVNLSKWPGRTYSTPGFGSSSRFHNLYLPINGIQKRKDWAVEVKTDFGPKHDKDCDDGGEDCDINYLMGAGKKTEEINEREPEPEEGSSHSQESGGDFDINKILNNPISMTAAQFKKLPKEESDDVDVAVDEDVPQKEIKLSPKKRSKKEKWSFLNN